MKKQIHYYSTGLVHGHYWGGGKGAYSARKLNAPTKEELLQKANEGLDGSLDGGMGYESLIGALLTIRKEVTIEIDGKTFVNNEYEDEFIGNLSESDQDFLLECQMN